ncbi:hypothetical protein ACB092_09G150600 [Castanea dentata]
MDWEDKQLILLISCCATSTVFLDSSCLHHSSPYHYSSPNPSSPVFNSFSPPIFFSINLLLLPMHLPLPFIPCSAHKKKEMRLLSLSLIFFFL